MSDPKEPHFFGREDERTLEWYHGLFSNVTDEIAIGEGSTSYTRYDIGPLASRSIFDLIPDCRLIYVVRHPIRRVESDWRMRQHEGWKSSSVTSAVRQALDQINEPVVRGDYDRWWKRHLLSQGQYWRNLSEYLKVFPDEQILVVFLEDFATSPESELARCLNHIGVDPLELPDEAEVLNRSTNTRADGRIARTLRRSKIFTSLKSITPDPLFRIAKASLTRKEEFVIEWDPDVLAELIDWYRNDSFKFLEYCGKSVGYWDWTV